MKTIDELDFDCFEFNDVTKGCSTSYLLGYLFGKYNLFDELNMDPMSLKFFSKKVEGGYIIISFKY